MLVKVIVRLHACGVVWGDGTFRTLSGVFNFCSSGRGGLGQLLLPPPPNPSLILHSPFTRTGARTTLEVKESFLEAALEACAHSEARVQRVRAAEKEQHAREVEALVVEHAAAQAKMEGKVANLRKEVEELRREIAVANRKVEAAKEKWIAAETALREREEALKATGVALARKVEENRQLRKRNRCTNDFNVMLSKTVVDDRVGTKSKPFSLTEKWSNWGGKVTCIHEDAENGRCTHSLSCKIGCSICHQPLCPAHIYRASDTRITERGHGFCSGCVVKINGALAVQSSIDVSSAIAKFYGLTTSAPPPFCPAVGVDGGVEADLGDDGAGASSSASS